MWKHNRYSPHASRHRARPPLPVRANLSTRDLTPSRTSLSDARSRNLPLMSRRRPLSKRYWWNFAPPGELYRHSHGDIVRCDALQMLNSLSNESAEIVFLDPPFNLGKVYGRRGPHGDRLDEDYYFRYLTEVLDRSIAVLKAGGALYVYHLPKWAVRIGGYLHRRLTFRHWIAISMKSGFARGRSLYPAHYGLLYYTKGEPRNFRRPKTDPMRCRHCGRYAKDYGGYTDFIRKGINLSDVWDDLSPVRHKKHKSHKSNELPFDIPERVISMSGRRGGLFVDPFAGSGTSLIAAIERGMNFVACDREREKWLLIRRRLSAL